MTWRSFNGWLDIAHELDISYVMAQTRVMSDVPVAAGRFLFGVPEELEQLLLDQLPSSSHVVFEHAPEAIFRRVEQEHFEVVVVDLAMPSLSGVEWLKLANRCSSPLVVLPADRRPHAPQTALRELDELRQQLAVLLKRLGFAPQLHKIDARETAAAEPIDAVRRRVLKASFEERAQLLSDCLSAPEVAELLRVTRQTPHDRAKSKTLLAVENNGSWRFPSWQFDASGPNGVISGLPDVLAALHVGPLAQARWLTKPNRAFEGRTPLQALRTGEVERVVSEARGVAGQAGS